MENKRINILFEYSKPYLQLFIALPIIIIFGFCFMAFLGFIFETFPLIWDMFSYVHFVCGIFALCYIAFLLIQIVFNKDFLCCALLMLTIPVYLIVIFLIGKYVPNNIIFAFLLVLFVCAIINNNNKRNE